MSAKKNLGSLFDDLDDGKPSPLTSIVIEKVISKEEEEVIVKPKEEIATTIEIVENINEDITPVKNYIVDNVEIITPNDQMQHDNIIEILDEEKKQDEYNEKAVIYLKSKNYYNKKKYANFYLRESTLDMISKLAGKGKGKTGYNKSELVDILLEEALGRLKVR